MQELLHFLERCTHNQFPTSILYCDSRIRIYTQINDIEIWIAEFKTNYVKFTKIISYDEDKQSWEGNDALKKISDEFFQVECND